MTTSLPAAGHTIPAFHCGFLTKTAIPEKARLAIRVATPRNFIDFLLTNSSREKHYPCNGLKVEVEVEVVAGGLGGQGLGLVLAVKVWIWTGLSKSGSGMAWPLKVWIWAGLAS